MNSAVVRWPQVLQLLLLLGLLFTAAVSALLQLSPALSAGLMAAGASLALALVIQILAGETAVSQASQLRVDGLQSDYRQQLRLLRDSANEEPARVAAVLDDWLEDRGGNIGGGQLSNAEQAAAVLMALEPATAAAVLRELRPLRVQQLADQMSQNTSADAQQLEQLLVRFNEAVIHFSLVRPSQADHVRNLLEAALGEEHASLVKGRLALHGQSRQIGKLKWLAAETIADMLEREHPQIQAVLIACLESAQAAEVLQCFELGRRRELLARLAALESLSPAALSELDWLVEQYLGDIGHSAGRHMTGEALAAALLNELDIADESALLEGLRERRPGLAERVEDRMFGFEQLQRLSDGDLNILVAQLNPLTIQRALQGAGGELRSRLRAVLEVQHPSLADIEPLGASEVELARQELVTVAKRLAGVGEIVLDARRLSMPR